MVEVELVPAESRVGYALHHAVTQLVPQTPLHPQTWKPSQSCLRNAQNWQCAAGSKRAAPTAEPRQSSHQVVSAAAAAAPTAVTAAVKKRVWCHHQAGTLDTNWYCP